MKLLDSLPELIFHIIMQNKQIPAVEVTDLAKSYGDVEALKGVDLEIGAGE